MYTTVESANARYHCLCVLLFMPAVHFIQSWTVHRSDLSSAAAADFFNTADLISAAEFDIVSLCHSGIVSSSLEQSIV
jgi:hypothetical protein